MDILTALKNEASKLQKQLDTVHAAMKVLGGNNGAAGAKRRPLSRSARARIAKAQSFVRTAPRRCLRSARIAVQRSSRDQSFAMNAVCRSQLQR